MMGRRGRPLSHTLSPGKRACSLSHTFYSENLPDGVILYSRHSYYYISQILCLLLQMQIVRIIE